MKEWGPFIVIVFLALFLIATNAAKKHQIEHLQHQVTQDSIWRVIEARADSLSSRARNRCYYVMMSLSLDPVKNCDELELPTVDGEPIL